MSCNPEKRKRINWTWAEERAMLNIFKEKNIHAKLDGREVRSDECYNEVSEEMAAEGYYRTASQVRIKYYALRSSFKDLKKKQNVSGAGSESIPHQQVLYELFGHRPAARLIDAGVDSGRNAVTADILHDEELPGANFLWATVGLGGEIAIDNPKDDDPDNPMPVDDLHAVLIPEEPRREPPYELPRIGQGPAHQPGIVQQRPVRQHPVAHEEPIHVAPRARQVPAGQPPVAVAEQQPLQQPPLDQQDPARQLGNPDAQAIGQDHPDAGYRENAAENVGMVGPQAPGPGQDRALHGVRRGVGRLQDRTKGKGSYAKALTNFHEQWSFSQRQLQEQMVERHEAFMKSELEASRRWEAEQQVLHEQHTRELINSSNVALTTAIDKLLGAFNKPPEQPQLYQSIAYPAGFPQPVHQFNYPINGPTPNSSPNSMYSATFSDNCNSSPRAITSPLQSPGSSSASSYSHHSGQMPSPTVLFSRMPNPNTSCTTSLPSDGNMSTSPTIPNTGSGDLTNKDL